MLQKGSDSIHKGSSFKIFINKCFIESKNRSSNICIMQVLRIYQITFRTFKKWILVNFYIIKGSRGVKLTISLRGSENTTGTDPVRWHPWCECKHCLKCKGINDQYLCIVTITNQSDILTVLEVVSLQYKQNIFWFYVWISIKPSSSG